MTAYLNGRLLGPEWPPLADDARLVCFMGPEDKGAWPRVVPERALAELSMETGGLGTRYESREGFDFILVQAEDATDPDAEPRQLQAVFTGRRLLVDTGGHPAMARVLADLAAHKGEVAPERVLYLMFARLTEGDSAALDDIEEAIAQLEEQTVAGSPPEGCTGLISDLRRRLLRLKRYYEALFDLLEDLEENANGFIGKAQLRSFRIQTNKADRLNRMVLNLRDYVTQVREAYQNQLDIGLNSTMKLFTVITAVFMPLTLLAGWYGMNLQMPEYNWPWAYPVLAGLCAVVVAGCLFYFKKKKWF